MDTNDIKVQTENFNPTGVEGPEQPNKKKVLIIASVIVAIVIVIGFGGAYFFLKMKNETNEYLPAQQMSESQQESFRQKAASSSDSLDSIDKDLNSIDLNSLEQDIQAYSKDLDGSF